MNVPFHDSNLIVISQDSEAHIPMKPIVEGMGLDWSYQPRKLSSNKERWSVAVIATVAQDPKNRDLLCIPLRKLFYSIQIKNLHNSPRNI
ncbi:phage antirepressor N-terminal domain-containing protein [Vibrio crassostreae]